MKMTKTPVNLKLHISFHVQRTIHFFFTWSVITNDILKFVEIFTIKSSLKKKLNSNFMYENAFELQHKTIIRAQTTFIRPRENNRVK